MARSNIHVGLEIGSTKTVMVVAEIKPDELSPLNTRAVRHCGSAKRDS